MSASPSYTAVADGALIAAGSAAEVARFAKAAGQGGRLMIFDDVTGRQVELDPFANPPAFALAEPPSQAEASPRPGRGRPKLGVVAREVTLLPRHWDWLAGQPGGASAALRRLVEDARRASEGADRARQAQEALYRVMSALAGDLPGFEEAARALYARDDARFDGLITSWPQGISTYLQRLAAIERAARPASGA